MARCHVTLRTAFSLYLPTTTSLPAAFSFSLAPSTHARTALTLLLCAPETAAFGTYLGNAVLGHWQLGRTTTAATGGDLARAIAARHHRASRRACCIPCRAARACFRHHTTLLQLWLHSVPPCLTYTIHCARCAIPFIFLSRIPRPTPARYYQPYTSWFCLPLPAANTTRPTSSPLRVPVGTPAPVGARTTALTHTATYRASYCACAPLLWVLRFHTLSSLANDARRGVGHAVWTAGDAGWCVSQPCLATAAARELYRCDAAGQDVSERYTCSRWAAHLNGNLRHRLNYRHYYHIPFYTVYGLVWRRRGRPATARTWALPVQHLPGRNAGISSTASTRRAHWPAAPRLPTAAAAMPSLCYLSRPLPRALHADTLAARCLSCTPAFRRTTHLPHYPIHGAPACLTHIARVHCAPHLFLPPLPTCPASPPALRLPCLTGRDREGGRKKERNTIVYISFAVPL